VIDFVFICHVISFLLAAATLCLIVDILLIIKRSPPGLLQARTFLKGAVGTHPYKLLLILVALLLLEKIIGVLAHVLTLPVDSHQLHDAVSIPFAGTFFIIIYMEYRNIRNLARGGTKESGGRR